MYLLAQELYCQTPMLLHTIFRATQGDSGFMDLGG